MFIGHYAVAFASKRFAPRTSLGALIAAAALLDLLWPIFILLGWEQVRIQPGNTAFTPLDFVSYPISHSLVAAVGWATLFALLYYAFTRYRAGAFVVWVGVVSHWVLDLVSHRPDLPLYPGGPRLGLGLWNSIIATVIVEIDVRDRGRDLFARDAAEGWNWQVGSAGFRGCNRGVLRYEHFQSAAAERAAAGDWSAGIEFSFGYVGLVGRSTSGGEVGVRYQVSGIRCRVLSSCFNLTPDSRYPTPNA